MYKEVHLGQSGRVRLMTGMEKMAHAVSATLGPKGRNVVFLHEDGVSAHVTKDGVTVAKKILCRDTTEHLGVIMLREAAIKTNEIAGDGTTTATVLAWKMIVLGNKLIAGGLNPIDIYRGMQEAGEDIKKFLDDYTHTIKKDQIFDVALISANNDSAVALLIDEAIKAVGPEGIILTQNSTNERSYVEKLIGLQYDKPLISEYLYTNTIANLAEYEHVFIAIFDEHISDTTKIEGLLRHCKSMNRPVLLIAPGYDELVISIMIKNKVSNGYKIMAIKSPGFGNHRDVLLEDICANTGAKIIKGNPLDNEIIASLGKAQRVISGKHDTTIMGGEGLKSEIDARVASIMANIETSHNDADREIHQKRLSGFNSGVAIIKVGGYSDLEVREKKDRVIDALNAAKAAVSEGILPGGGIALFKAAFAIMQNTNNNTAIAPGYKLVSDACKEPLLVILRNAGEDPNIIVPLIGTASYSWGYNIESQQVGDMFGMKIIDPLKVTRTALNRAIAVAGMVLLTEAVIYEDLAINGSPSIVDLKSF